jgi:hypothetical protein
VAPGCKKTSTDLYAEGGIFCPQKLAPVGDAVGEGKEFFCKYLEE